MKRALERLIRSENARNFRLLPYFVWPAARNSHLFPKKGAGLAKEFGKGVMSWEIARESYSRS